MVLRTSGLTPYIQHIYSPDSPGRMSSVGTVHNSADALLLGFRNQKGKKCYKLVDNHIDMNGKNSGFKPKTLFEDSNDE